MGSRLWGCTESDPTEATQQQQQQQQYGKLSENSCFTASQQYRKNVAKFPPMPTNAK